jgi:hypothetical protein
MVKRREAVHEKSFNLDVTDATVVSVMMDLCPSHRVLTTEVSSGHSSKWVE